MRWDVQKIVFSGLPLTIRQSSRYPPSYVFFPMEMTVDWFKGTLIHHERCSGLTSKLTNQMCLYTASWRLQGDARDLEGSKSAVLRNSKNLACNGWNLKLDMFMYFHDFMYFHVFSMYFDAFSCIFMYLMMYFPSQWVQVKGSNRGGRRPDWQVQELVGTCRLIRFLLG